MPTNTNTSTSSGGAKEAFFYLLSFFLLYLVVPAVGVILFQLINKYFPDKVLADFESLTVFQQGVVRSSLAALLISGPLYFFVTGWIQRQLKRGNMNPHSGVRRWLTYLSLFVAAAIIVGDLIVTLFSFLNGDLGTRFLLKALTILVLGLFTSAYYVWDIRRENVQEYTSIGFGFGGAALLCTVVVITLGFSIASTPVSARKQRIDEQRIRSLSFLQSALDSYAFENGTLPPTREALLAARSPHNNASYVPNTNDFSDPETGVSYEYTVTGPTDYTLCAVFATAVSEKDAERSYPYYSGASGSFAHPAGHACFSRAVTFPSPKPQVLPPVRY